MKLSYAQFFKNKSIAIYVFYFLVLLSVALFVRDSDIGNGAYNEIDPHLTLEQVVEKTRPTDASAFALGGLEFGKHGSVDNFPIVFELWPPAFVFVQGSIYKIFGKNAPIILILQILNVGLFACLLTMLQQLIRERKLNTILATLLPLILLLYPSIRLFVQPGGAVLGEGLAASFFFIGFLLFVKAVTEKNMRHIIYASIVLALSAYFRSQFEIFILGLTFFGALFILYFKFLQKNKSEFFIKAIVFFILTTTAVMLPWRIHNLITQKNLLWVQTSKISFRNSVSTPEQLHSIYGNAYFIINGGGHLTCLIDESTCGDYENAVANSVKTLIKHPIQWYSIKFELIDKYDYWCEKSSLGAEILDGLLLVLLICALFLPFFNPLRKHHLLSHLLIWFNFGIISAHILMLTFQHIEARYFYFIKIYGLLVFMIEMALLLDSKISRKTKK